MNIEPKIIKTEAEYRTYLSEVEQLAIRDPVPGTPEGDRLELLVKLVEDYEVQRFKFEKPDPIDAIRFRMEEQGLRQKDLIPILGGKNRVSEVLSGKRPLTVTMIRALNKTLKISAELLIREPEPEPYSFASSQLGLVYFKNTIPYGSTTKTDKRNLERWIGEVRAIADATRNQRGQWHPEVLSDDFLSEIALLSAAADGPSLAKELLHTKGIALVIHPALSKTKLDGAAMCGADGSPVIGLTIRHDRLDNFWFTLLHEIAHAWKHLSQQVTAITDEDVELREDDDENEAEANRVAKDAFIPRSQWKRSEAFLRPTKRSILELAQNLNIHPAVVAGRLRREKSGYRSFSDLVGHRQVRRLFPEVNWP